MPSEQAAGVGWRRRIPVDCTGNGAGAAFAFDCAGDPVSSSLALLSVGRSLAAILPDAPRARMVVSAGVVANPPGISWLPPVPPQRQRFVVTLSAPRLVSCAVLRLWSRLAPRTAIAGGVAGPDLLTEWGLHLRLVIDQAQGFLLEDDSPGLESALRGAALPTFRLPPEALHALAAPL